MAQVLTWGSHEAGCPGERLARSASPAKVPSPAPRVTGQVGCFSAGCEEGCHCPEGTFLHRSACVRLGLPCQKPRALPFPVSSHL